MLTQFLVEGIVMGIIGGLAGLVIGYTGAKILGHFTGWETSISPLIMLGALLLANRAMNDPRSGPIPSHSAQSLATSRHSEPPAARGAWPEERDSDQRCNRDVGDECEGCPS